MKNFLAGIKNASGWAHSLVLIIAGAAILYNTSASYKATVLALWGYFPRWLKLGLEIVLPPLLVYWNSQKKNGVSTNPYMGAGGTPAKMIALFLVPVLVIGQTSCNFATGLSTLSSDLEKIQPFLQLVPAFVCGFSTDVCSQVEKATALAVNEDSTLSALFQTWSAASAQAQPGLFAQMVAACQVLQGQEATLVQAAQVKNSAEQTQVNAMISAILGATGDLWLLIEEVQSKGGTSQALAEILDQADPERDTLSPWLAAVSAKTIAAYPLKLFKSSETYKLKSGAVVHTWKYHQKNLLARLSKKTGNVPVDALSATLAKQVKGW